MAGWSPRAEVVRLLQDLLRLNTVNPPGNETSAAEVLRGYLEAHGVACELYARVPDRANLVARIRGRDPAAPRLLLLSHTDTVVADRSEWTVDPWSGELRDDHVWGRGALDMKGHVAASAVAVAALARDGFRPEGDLVLAATADEEVGAGYGLEWLCRAHPETVRAAWCVNEGSGDRIELGEQVLYLIATAEKATSPFTVAIAGKSGHASAPMLADNPLPKAGVALQRLGAFSGRRVLYPETRALLEALLGSIDGDVDHELARLASISESAARMLEPMLAATVAPTQMTSSSARNVIPGRCQITCDCRVLPEQAQSEVESEVRDALGALDYELTWGDRTGGSRSSIDTPLWQAIASFVHEIEPGARVAPILLAGFTDSHHLRKAFGTVAYGFFPMRAMDPQVAASLIHSADERVHVADLELGTRFFVHLARELLG